MFSTQPRCIYSRNALNDVICQLRYPDIPDFGPELPEEFVNEITKDFPRHTIRREPRRPEPGKAPGGLVYNHEFATEDRMWRVNITGFFISLSCTQYTRWEVFARKLDKPLFTFLQHYRPEHFTRVGLRYVNIFSRRDLGLTDCRFRELFAPCYLGPLADDDTLDAVVTRCTVDTEINIGNSCRAKIHAGPGTVHRFGKPDAEVKFIFDQDLSLASPTDLPRIPEVLELLHGKSFSIFRGAITDRLSDALMDAAQE